MRRVGCGARPPGALPSNGERTLRTTATGTAFPRTPALPRECIQHGKWTVCSSRRGRLSRLGVMCGRRQLLGQLGQHPADGREREAWGMGAGKLASAVRQRRRLPPDRSLGSLLPAVGIVRGSRLLRWLGGTRGAPNMRWSRASGTGHGARRVDSTRRARLRYCAQTLRAWLRPG